MNPAADPPDGAGRGPDGGGSAPASSVARSAAVPDGDETGEASAAAHDPVERQPRNGIDDSVAFATEVRLRQEVSQLQARLERIESRRVWRLVRVLDTSSRSPRGWLTLPWRLLRELLGALRGRRAPKLRRSAPSGSVGPQLAVEPPTIPKLPPKSVVPNRPDLVVAGILDTFSVESFKHEFNLVELERSRWRDQLSEHPPDLLFVESAWRGADGRWTKALSDPAGPADDIRELVEHCRSLGIPTVFWNKEDPPNYDRFVRSAALFDHVFTVDQDCVPRYLADLGHDRVHVLPFAAQPAITNPAAVPGGREYALAFAGTYFADKHPDRRAQMDMLLSAAREFGLHIFSRFTGDDRYAFPAPFDQHVVGSLPYQDMPAAYRRYRVFLNVNSVSTSPSTCSRRVFECLASGTPLVSTPARAFSELFGDDPPIVTAEDEDSARQQLSVLLRQDELRDRLATRGLRAVMEQHTYRHRVDEMLAVALPERPTLPAPLVSAVVCTMRQDSLEAIVANLSRQQGVRLQVILVTHGFEVDEQDVAERLGELEDLRVISAPRERTLGDITDEGFRAATGDILTKMDDDDYYGENYLRDQVAAFEYTDAEVVGKQSVYAYLRGPDLTVLRFPGREHREVNFVAGPTIAVRRDAYLRCSFADRPNGIDTDLLQRAKAAGMRVYSTDRFNFMYMRGADRLGHTWKTDDLRFLQNGLVAFQGQNLTHVEV